MTKKFSIKKLVAGVLAAAMVVTALPVSGLSVKAAESGTKPVYVLYDANRGEHYLTADPSEKDGLLAIGWTEGNIAWMSPAKSNTPVYGLYNPNNGGDHYYTSDANEKNGLLAQGWKEGDVKFYSDDEKGVLINTLYNPNAPIRNHHYTASLEETNGLVALGWQNHTNTATAIYGVGTEVSGVVSLTDVQGFQADDTGLVGDTLQIVFGASFGVPKSVAWYKNGAAVATATDNLSPNNGLALTIADNAILGAGDYYAQVENTQGKVYKTNTVTMVDEGTVILSDFALADNYEALATYGDKVGAQAVNIVPCNTDTKYAVVDITFNKLYDGTLSIVEYDEDMDKLSSTPTNTVWIDQHGLYGFEEVKKQSDLTNAVLYDKCINRTNGKYKASGIYYKDKSDKYHVKALADLATVTFDGNGDIQQNLPTNALKRGKEYVAIFKEGSSALASGDELKDLVVSKPVKCPYLMKPTKLVVEGRQADTNNTSGWKAQLYVGDQKAAYINNIDSSLNITQPAGDLELWAGDKKDMSDGGAVFNSQVGGNTTYVIKEGAAEATHNATKRYVQAKYVSEDDIFGEDAIKLESEVVEAAVASANGMKMKESGDDAKDAVVEFNALRSKANGTVYIFQKADSGDNFADVAGYDTKDAVASAKVTGGSDDVTVKKAFKKVYTATAESYKNDYVAVFVPDDDTYSKLAAGTSTTQEFTLAQVPTSFTMEEKTSTDASTGSAITVTDATTRVNDQFGDKINGTLSGGFVKTYELKALQTDGLTKSATLTISAGSAGKATLAIHTFGRDGAAVLDSGTEDGEAVFYAKAENTYVKVEKTDNPGEWKFTASDKVPTL